jgi:hypothetical protein
MSEYSVPTEDRREEPQYRGDSFDRELDRLEGEIDHLRAALQDVLRATRLEDAHFAAQMYLRGLEPTASWLCAPEVPRGLHYGWETQPLYAHPLPAEPSLSMGERATCHLGHPLAVNGICFTCNPITTQCARCGGDSPRHTPLCPECETEDRYLHPEELRFAAPSREGTQADGADRVRTLDEWHDDDGDALWWFFPIVEPPYVGSPLDTDWPGYHTHWTRIPVPLAPTREAPPEKVEGC